MKNKPTVDAEFSKVTVHYEVKCGACIQFIDECTCEGTSYLLPVTVTSVTTLTKVSYSSLLERSFLKALPAIVIGIGIALTFFAIYILFCILLAK